MRDRGLMVLRGVAAEAPARWAMPGLATGFAIAALLALAALALIAPGAWAADQHYCPQGPGPQQCERPAGVATDAESGLLYIADEAQNRVQVFDEDGDLRAHDRRRWGAERPRVGWRSTTTPPARPTTTSS